MKCLFFACSSTPQQRNESCCVRSRDLHPEDNLKNSMHAILPWAAAVGALALGCTVDIARPDVGANESGIVQGSSGEPTTSVRPAPATSTTTPPIVRTPPSGSSSGGGGGGSGGTCAYFAEGAACGQNGGDPGGSSSGGSACVRPSCVDAASRCPAGSFVGMCKDTKDGYEQTCCDVDGGSIPPAEPVDAGAVPPPPPSEASSSPTDSAPNG
jgi:hypothetical protein